MSEKDLLVAEKFIPHRRRMMLIDRIKEPDENGLQAYTTVSKDWPMYEKGGVSSIICIELIAQSISALSTWWRGPASKPRVGLLVGVKKAEFTTVTVPIGSKLTITVDTISRIGNYGVFKGEVASGATNLCKAVIQAIDSEEDILREIEASKHLEL